MTLLGPSVTTAAGETKKSPSSRVQRFVTGAVAIPIALGLVFFLPRPAILVVSILVFGGAAVEYVRLVRHWAPSAPLGIVPPAAGGIALGVELLTRGGQVPLSGTGLAVLLVAAFGCVLLLSGLLTLMSPTRMPEAMIGTGLIHFGIPYFALPMVSVFMLAVLDPWILTLLLGAVWAGDTFAYLFGSWFGRRKMAPVVSPNKSWEGAFAGLAGSIGVALLWCMAYRGRVDLELVAVTAAAAAAGQLGDLLESMIKRGVGVKDSSNLLPGHGGLFDRLDAMLLAAPVFVVGLWLIGEMV